MMGEDDLLNSESSSGYSSATSSGNSSPEINCIGSRTAEVTQFNMGDQDVLQDRLLNHISQPDKNTVTPSVRITSVEQSNVPENVKQTIRDLADDIVHHVAGTRKRKPPSKYAETLRRTTEEMFTRHQIFFNGGITKMQVDKNNANTTFQHVADEIFADGVCNWGRIISLYAFAGRLAQHCCKMSNEKNDKMVSQLGAFIGSYIVENLSGWIHSNGGWDAFDEQFQSESRFEDTVKKGLLVTALGLGALATLILAR